MTTKIRLLLADDEHLIRGALEALLNLEPDITVVSSADNGITAAELAAELQPDVCLLDLEMPGADGLETATRILATTSAHIIIVTRHARPGVLRPELDVLRASRVHDSVQAIASALFLSPGTVRNYASAAMAKLGESSRHAAATKAWQQGWI